MKKIITIVFTFHASLLTFHATEAQVINVPADQPTIQAGINSASSGDTVLVSDGTYLENIDFSGKAITVASQFIVDGDTSQKYGKGRHTYSLDAANLKQGTYIYTLKAGNEILTRKMEVH